MIKRKLWGLLYILIVLGTLAAAEWGCRTVSVMVEAAPLKRGNCIIIDAGHGEDVGVQVWSLLVLTLTQVGTVLLCRGAMRSAKQAAPGA